VPEWVCPECRSLLEPEDAATLRCPRDGFVVHEVGGVWRFLGRREEYREFVERYAAVRRAEGWGSEDPAYFQALPYRDLSGRHPEIWRLRAVSFRALTRRLVEPLARRRGPLAALDLGAGNGWLSYRLAAAGHRPVAVDLTDDGRDGLGAARHYPLAFPRVQASFDRLPWADGGFDLAVFNGALHYSRDCAATLGEARRLLRPGGRLAVMDTPIYRRRASGEQMLRELDESLRERHGEGREEGQEGFLTRGRLARLGAELALDWRVVRPFYGLRWALLPWKARLLRWREPMRFHLLVARRREDPED
jgi:SAM-dependent methyltransferase